MRGPIVRLYLFIIIFTAGIVVGYFVERTGIIYTQAEIDKLRLEVENMQLQEMFVAGTDTDCRLLYSTMGKLSYDLYSLVNTLQAKGPGSEEFMQTKIQADLLSLRAWLLARSVKKSCSEELVPILFVYSSDCEGCEEQDAILQNIQNTHDEVLVYSNDYDSAQPAIKLRKDAN